jgi:hypothetical protein
MDPSMLMGLTPDFSDPTAFGIDAAMVGLVNEGTNRVKEYLETVSWDDPFSRFYFLIPFGVAFALCYFLRPSLTEALTDSVKYGLWATFAWQAYRVGLKNK